MPKKHVSTKERNAHILQLLSCILSVKITKNSPNRPCPTSQTSPLCPTKKTCSHLKNYFMTTYYSKKRKVKNAHQKIPETNRPHRRQTAN